MFGSNFGNTSFGGGGFSSAPPNTSVFGQPQQQPTNTGGSSSLFGGGVGGFGAQQKSTFGATPTFGAPQTQQTTLFGQGNRLQSPSTGGLFSGQTAAVSPFSMGMGGQQVPTGTSIQFNPINGTDTMMKNGTAVTINTKHQCITCMKEYENKSLEELRLEDYQLNRKGPQQQQVGGLFGVTPQPQQQAGGLFSGMATATSTPFGQTSTFGSTNTGGGLFSSLSQPKPAESSFFSGPTTSAFGTGATNTAFSFNNPTSQPSVFGVNNNPATTGGLGTSTFSFGQPQNQTSGLFGQKPLTSVATTGFGGGTFGSTAFTNTSTANKPAVGFSSGFGTNTTQSFGSTPATTFGTGTGGLFSQAVQPQQKPFAFSTPFSSQAQPTQSTFGAPSSTAFSFNTPASSAPTLGGFGTSTNTFGTGLGAPTNTFSMPSFGQTQQPNFSFGSSTAPGTAFPNFAPAGNFNQSMQQQQLAPPTGVVGFATTPYKDSPLFYNLIANRDLDNLIKPTSPAAQRAIKEASRRRTSNSLSLTNNILLPQKSQSFSGAKTFNKQTIFDGFEEDMGYQFDILSPKSSVKKLTIKSFNNPTTNSSHRHSISFSSSMKPSQSFAEIGNVLEDSGILDSSYARAKDYENNSTCVISSPIKSMGEIFSSAGDESLNAPSPLILNKKRFSDPASFSNGLKENNKCRVVNTRAGYYIKPSIDELNAMVDEQGNCFVKGLIIGRENHGEIKFFDSVNVAGANIDEIVHFRHKEVIVYPDDNSKPPLGEGLNFPALVSLERVWPVDQVTKNPIKFPPKLQNMGYEKVLQRACTRLGAEFVSYNPEEGIWTFKVPHFSKYSCELEETEAAIDPVEGQGLPSKGLGGVLTQQNQQTNAPKVLSAPRPDSWTIPEGIRHRQSTVPMSTEDNVDYGGRDVEHNPLTPSDSNDSDSDWVQPELLSTDTQYESIMKEKADSSTVQMMKSALMMPDHGDGVEMLDIQPPSKKSKQPIAKSKDMIRNFEINISDLKQRKSVMELQHQKPGPPLSALVTMYEKGEETKGKKIDPAKTNYITSKTRKLEASLSTPSDDNQFENTALHSVDLNQFKATPRVIFGPRGTFITVQNAASTTTPKVILNRLTSHETQMSNPLYMQVLEEQLRKFLKGDHPRATQQVDVLWNFSLTHKDDPIVKDLKREIMMWELFRILFALEIPYEEMKSLDYRIQTRDKLSKWLSKYGHYLFPDAHSYDPSRTVLGLLKMGLREEASLLAIKQQNYYLALLIAQAPLVKVTNSNCGEQLEIWEQEDALKFMTPDITTVYKLCAGNTLLNEVDLSKMSTTEWLQHFAIYVWYVCPLNVPVDEAVVSFQHLLKSGLAAQQGDWSAEQVSRVPFPSVCDSSIPNLCIQLLKFFSFDGYPINKIVDPRTYSLDCLDYKLSWFLMGNFVEMGLGDGQNEPFNNICTSFANQLENIGLYCWSLVALSSGITSSYRQQIVERNITLRGSMEDEMFLFKNNLVEPLSIFYEAKALKAIPYITKESSSIWLLLKSGHADKAFEELQKSFNVDTINSPDSTSSMLELLNVFQGLNLQNWHPFGSFMLDTFRFLEARVAILKHVNDGTETPNHFFGVINNFLASFVQYKPKTGAESGLFIDLAVLIQRMVAELLMNNPESIKNIDSEHIRALLELPVPKDYRHELTYFLSAYLK